MAKLALTCKKRDALVSESIETLISIGAWPLISADLLQMAAVRHHISADKSVWFKVSTAQVTRVLLAMGFEPLGVFRLGGQRGRGSMMFSKFKSKFVTEHSHGFGDAALIQTWVLMNTPR